MIKIAALTSGRNIPSTRFRIRQHIKPLEKYSMRVDEYYPAISKDLITSLLPSTVRGRHIAPLLPFLLASEVIRFINISYNIMKSRWHDLIWLERGLYPGYPTIERALKKPLVLDVDDAVWLLQPFGMKQMIITARRADRIISGNQYIAEWLSKYNRNVEIIPTAIDTEQFFPIQKNEDQPFTIGWTGTSYNFKYLYDINNALKSFFNLAKDSRMLITADKYPSGLDIPSDRLDFIKWSEDNEINAVQKMDIGLMPLQDDSWTRGKCSFKMLQYMSCGKPVVASPVGMNIEVLKKGNIGFGPIKTDDWLDALIYLYENRSECINLGQNGRAVVERDFSRKIISKRLADVFREVE